MALPVARGRCKEATMNRLFSVTDRADQQYDRFYVVADNGNMSEDIKRLTTNSHVEIIVEFLKWLKEGKS